MQTLLPMLQTKARARISWADLCDSEDDTCGCTFAVKPIDRGSRKDEQADDLSCDVSAGEAAGEAATRKGQRWACSRRLQALPPLLRLAQLRRRRRLPLLPFPACAHAAL